MNEMQDAVRVAGRTDAGELILHIPPQFEELALELVEEQAYA